jgi:hypothetical protein
VCAQVGCLKTRDPGTKARPKAAWTKQWLKKGDSPESTFLPEPARHPKDWKYAPSKLQHDAVFDPLDWKYAPSKLLHDAVLATMSERDDKRHFSRIFEERRWRMFQLEQGNNLLQMRTSFPLKKISIMRINTLIFDE